MRVIMKRTKYIQNPSIAMDVLITRVKRGDIDNLPGTIIGLPYSGVSEVMYATFEVDHIIDNDRDELVIEL